MKRTNFHIAEDQLRRLRELAERKQASVADLVRRAIEAYLSKEEEKERR